MLAVIPFLRRDWKFMVWTAGWCFLLLLCVPAVLFLGTAATFELYRIMFTEHLAGIASGAMSNQDRERRSRRAAHSSIGIGAVVARLAAGESILFGTAAAMGVAAIQFLFNAAVVVAVVVLGRGGFWSFAWDATCRRLSAPRCRRGIVRSDTAYDRFCRTAIRHVRLSADGLC